MQFICLWEIWATENSSLPIVLMYRILANFLTLSLLRVITLAVRVVTLKSL